MSHATHAAAPAHDHGISHVASKGVLVIVFAALIFLTAITVAVRAVDLDAITQIDGLNFLVAMVIATLKALLVALFFMHLIYDQPFNAMLLLVGLAFVALFLSFVLFDSLEYQPDVRTYEQRSQQFAPPSGVPAPAQAG